MSSSNIYFETSAVNYLAQNLTLYDAIATRGLQLARGNRWYISPVTLWEILLTTEERVREELLFFSQHLFFDRLLKTPSEISIDYITSNCRKIQSYTEFHSGTDVANIWNSICKDSRMPFDFDHQALVDWTSHIKLISKKADKIINGIILSEELQTDEQKLSLLLQHIYESLPYKSDIKPIKQLQKLAIVFLFYYLCIGIDLTPEIIDAFWHLKGIQEPISRLYYLLSNYPSLIQQGPFMEFAIMAQNQIKLSPKTGRGLFHDSLHCIYLPFIDIFFTNDNHFISLRKLNIFQYHKKIKSIIHDVNYTGKLTKIE
jgi:hypothetical protein